MNMFKNTFEAYVQQTLHGTILPNIGNANALEIRIQNVLNSCHNQRDLIRNKLITIPNCNSSIIWIAIVSGLEWVNGNWIFVSNNKILAFHYPLNEGINVMIDVYFKDDPVLIGYFGGALPMHDYHEECLNAFFGAGIILQYPLIPQFPATPVSIQSLMSSFTSITHTCQDLIYP
jgi:hypothetical protein